jgi:hypothetical protein
VIDWQAELVTVVGRTTIGVLPACARRTEINKIRFVKAKVKFSLEQATKTKRGSTGIDLLFL